MAYRSPILGYNHNVTYRGLVFHVQTEDSGVDNPHVFTHLFQGGVILSTRKLEYDGEALEEEVKGLMQSQHKAMLKGLKRGEFDDKIDRYFGSDPKLKPRSGAAAATSSQESDSGSDSSAATPTSGTATTSGASRPTERDPATPASPAPTSEASSPAIPAATTAPASTASPDAAAARPSQPMPREGMRTGRMTTPSVNFRPRRHTRPGTSGQTLVQRAPPPVADRTRGTKSGKVMVSAPPIVVDSNAKTDPSKPEMRTPRAREVEQDSVLAKERITEKSLDEVILAYLSEDADD